MLSALNAPPVALRELLVASRRPATRWVRQSTALACTVAVALPLLISSTAGSAMPGDALFAILTGMTAAVVAIASLLFTCDALSAEQRQGTLGLLFLTDLTGFEVVSGKLVAAGLNAAGALITVFPFIAVTLVMGGVTAGDVFRTSLALLNLLWVFLGLGLAMSARTSSASRSFTAAALWALLLGAAFPIGAELVPQIPLGRDSLPFRLLRLLFEASPIRLLGSARDLPYRRDPSGFWIALAVSHTVGWIFLAIAGRQVRRLWRNDGSRTAEAEPTPRRTVGTVRNAAQNPVATLYGTTRGERIAAWAIVGVTAVLTGMLWNSGIVGLPMPVYGAWPFVPGFLLLRGMFAWKCCGGFQELRDGGGELLLTTPLTEQQILGGVWAGGRQWIQGPLLALFGLQLFTLGVQALGNAGPSAEFSRAMASGFFGTSSSVLMIVGLLGFQYLTLALDFLALGWLSARFGLRSPNRVQAFGVTVALVFLPRTIVFCLPNVLSSTLLIAWGHHSVSGKVRRWLTGQPDSRPWDAPPPTPPHLPLPASGSGS